MQTHAMPTIALRFSLGFGMVTLLAALVFRSNVFLPASPMFRSLTAGAMLAGVLALMRSDRGPQAGALATALALLRLGFAHSQGWTAAVAGVFEVGGLFLVALIFDLLARRGILFGKFLVLGPLLGGVYLATTQLSVMFQVTGVELMPTLMRHVFIGLLIGDSVGFGIEVADLLVLARSVGQQRSTG
ncbi:MAG TPA: hypothetical protein VD788_12175 [Candidatus Polarisedimenticolaceae bacterium]|nr:hypothetical protein [Candidatus Polarisedimenticolaceae bacterium]